MPCLRAAILGLGWPISTVVVDNRFKNSTYSDACSKVRSEVELRCCEVRGSGRGCRNWVAQIAGTMPQHWRPAKRIGPGTRQLCRRQTKAGSSYCYQHRAQAGSGQQPTDRSSCGTTTTKPNPATKAGGYWLNTKSNKRHNSSCRYYGKIKNGRRCGKTEGRPCGICGG